jgi:hypothetical protein
LTKVAAVRRRSLLLWSGLFAVAALAVIVGFAVFWVRSHRRAPETLDLTRGSQNVRIASRFVSPGDDEALALVNEALANRDPGMVESSMRPGTTEPGKIVEFMKELATRDGGIQRISWLSSMDVDGMLMEGAQVVSGKTAPIAYIAFLVPDDAGVWKMDFDAFARVSTPPWKEFLAGGADSARVRVLVAKDSYFNGPFLDESFWECYGLAAPELKECLPDGQEVLRGYCRKDSSQAKAMARIFQDQARMHRATLEIRKTEGADSRQFEITRVLSEEWVLPEVPLDEKFN